MNTATTAEIDATPRTFTSPASLAALRIKNVLLPTDFSEASLGAIQYALPLIRHFQPQVHLMHAFETSSPLANLAPIPLVLPEQDITDRVEHHLQDLAAKLQLPTEFNLLHAIKGLPFSEICRLARERQIDLMIISTHGNTGLKYLALGSTADLIVRYSPCPVLVIPVAAIEKAKAIGQRARSNSFGLRKILVPVDFSDCSLRGLAYARALAKETGAKILLLNAIALQCYVTGDEFARYDFPMLMEQAEKNARELMDQFLREMDQDGIEVETSLQIGHAGQQIGARADEEQADLIVMSTHGTTGLKHILLGSTAEYVVRHAHCPVLVVPTQERPVLQERSA